MDPINPGSYPVPAPTLPTDADIKALASQVAKVETLRNQVAGAQRDLGHFTAAMDKESAALEAMRGRFALNNPAATPAPTPNPQ